MSLLDALNKQRSERKSALGAVRRECVALSRKLDAQAEAIHAAKENLAKVNARIASFDQQGKLVLTRAGAAIIILALLILIATLILSFLRLPVAAAMVPLPIPISVPVFVPAGVTATDASPSFITYIAKDWGFESGKYLSLVRCERETQQVKLDEATWVVPDDSSASMSINTIFEHAQRRVLAVVIEAGHDARELPPTSELTGNWMLAERRVRALRDVVQAALGSAKNRTPIVLVPHGAGEMGRNDYCEDRKPRITLVMRTARSEP